MAGPAKTGKLDEAARAQPAAETRGAKANRSPVSKAGRQTGSQKVDTMALSPEALASHGLRGAGLTAEAAEQMALARPVEVVRKPVDVPALLEVFRDEPEATAALQRLAKKDVLGIVDGQGQTVAQNLCGLMNLPEAVGSGIPGKRLALETIRHLDNPDRLTQGKGTNSCTAAVAQVLYAQGHPAEYTRMIHDLASKGVATTLKGDAIEADWRGLGQEEGRDSVEDLMQESLLSFADRTFLPEGDGLGNGIYRAQRRNGSGVFRPQRRNGADEAAGEPAESVSGEEVRALTASQFSGLMQSLTGRSFLPLQVHPKIVAPVAPWVYDEYKSSILSTFKKAVAQGPVPISIRHQGTSSTADLGHQLTVRAISEEPGRPLMAEIHDPGDGRVEWVPFEDLMKQTEYVSIPFKSLEAFSFMGSSIGGVAQVRRRGEMPRGSSPIDPFGNDLLAMPSSSGWRPAVLLESFQPNLNLAGGQFGASGGVLPPSQFRPEV